jgi:transposase
VKLSSLPGVLIKDVAAALDIHPFMLSLWRKQVRDGVIVARSANLDVRTVAELRRLRELERRYKVLKEEHELLKKAIRFASDRRQEQQMRRHGALEARRRAPLLRANVVGCAFWQEIRLLSHLGSG